MRPGTRVLIALVAACAPVAGLPWAPGATQSEPVLDAMFGLVLGQPPDQARFVEEGTDEQGRAYRRVMPPNVSPPFLRFRVYTTPDGRVHTIMGEAPYRSAVACRLEAIEFNKKLIRRFGEPADNLLKENGPVRYASGERSIVLSCLRWQRGWLLNLTASDRALRAEADR